MNDEDDFEIALTFAQNYLFWLAVTLAKIRQPGRRLPWSI